MYHGDRSHEGSVFLKSVLLKIQYSPLNFILFQRSPKVFDGYMIPHNTADLYKFRYLSSISKVLEIIVAEKLVYHLNIHDLLYQHQYGFLTQRSTEQNLMQILNFVTKALNDRYCP
jgi:hypothetical protein